MLYFLGFGGNSGNVNVQFNTVLSALSQIGFVTKKSSLYKTAPFGYKDQNDFLNAAIGFKTQLKPHDLLHSIKKIEVQLGRVKRFRWGPREIDIDILEYDGMPIQSADLNIPHAGLEKRRFVLLPLAEIEPRFLNRNGIDIHTLINRCTDSGKIERLNDKW